MPIEPHHRRRLHITLEGVITIIIASCILGASFVQNVNLLVLIFALTIAVSLSAYLLCRRNLQGVRVQRRLPPEAFAGSSISVQIEVQHTEKRRPAWGIAVADQLTLPDGEPVRKSLFFTNVRAGQTSRLHYELVSESRGKISFDRLTLSSSFPLGVFESRVTISDPQELVIYPKIGQLHEFWRQRMRGQHLLGASRAPDSGTNEFDFHSLREYRFGDSLRHVHWRTTARRGELMIKEFEPLETRDVLLIIDAYSGSEDWDTFEKMVSFVATCCVELCRWPGNRLILAIASKNPVVLDRQTSARTAQDLLRA